MSRKEDFDAPEDEVVETMLSLASGKLDEAQLTEWIRSRAKRHPRR